MPRNDRSTSGRYNLGVRIVTSAPTRIDLAGGTIDIWPLYLFHPGAQTLNAAISVRATARLESRDDGRIAIRSEDTGVSLEADDWRELWDRKELRLLSFLVHFFEARGITLTTSSQSPAGAGIAGSSALNVAVCAALAEWKRTHYDPEGLLQVAMNVEARAINVPTGLQDYRPALYGGIAAVELEADGVKRVPLNVDLAELQKRIVLCYTGEPQKLRHEQLGDYQASHRRRPVHLRLLRTHPRHRCRHARGARARRLGCGRPRDCAGVGEPEAAGAWRDHARHRRSDCPSDCGRRDGGEGLRCWRRRLHVQLRASSSARRSLLPLPAEVRGCSTIRSSATGCRVDNKSIAQVLAQIADLLEIKDENAFKIRAYRSAADVIATWPDAVARMDAQQLRAIPGVGEDLAAKIRELAELAARRITRSCSHSSRQRSSICSACRVSGRKRWRCSTRP